MSGRNDYEIRYKAIRLHQGGIGFNDVLRRVRRSCFRLTKWLQRYREHGLAGLRDQSRAPKRIHNRTPEPLVRKILALRDALAAHKGRRAAFAGIGAETIHFELQRRGLRRLPAISTIEKILARAGKTKKVKGQRLAGGPPYPHIRARRMGDLQQTDLVGPRYLRGSRGVTRFYSIHTIDVAGQTASVSQFPDKRTISLCRHLPDGFSLDPYIDARGHQAIPIAKGRVSFVRKVDAHGCIEFNGADIELPPDNWTRGCDRDGVL